MRQVVCGLLGGKSLLRDEKNATLKQGRQLLDGLLGGCNSFVDGGATEELVKERSQLLGGLLGGDSLLGSGSVIEEAVDGVVDSI